MSVIIKQDTTMAHAGLAGMWHPMTKYSSPPTLNPKPCRDHGAESEVSLLRFTSLEAYYFLSY